MNELKPTIHFFRQHWLILVLGCAPIVFSVMYFVPSGHITNYPIGTGPIIMLGDSLVFGVGATPGNDLVSNLSRMVGKPIMNMGVSGDTTSDVLKRLRPVLDANPSIVIILIGGNDYLRQVPIETVFQNLRMIVDRIQANGAATIILGVRGRAPTNMYAPQYERVAEETGSLYVPDVLKNIANDQTLMADFLHPNDKGYERMAERVYPALRQLLE